MYVPTYDDAKMNKDIIRERLKLISDNSISAIFFDSTLDFSSVLLTIS